VIDGIGPIRPTQGGKGIEPSSKEKLKEKEKIRSESLEVGETKKVEELVRMARDSEEIRTELVEQLREALEKGIYVVDAERLARKILEEWE